MTRVVLLTSKCPHVPSSLFGGETLIVDLGEAFRSFSQFPSFLMPGTDWPEHNAFTKLQGRAIRAAEVQSKQKQTTAYG